MPGSVGLHGEVELAQLVGRLEADLGGDAAIAWHLASTYGCRAAGVIEIARAEPDTATRLIEGLPFIWAEVLFAVRQEMALTPADVLIRRLGLFHRAEDQGISVVERATALMAGTLSWTADEQGRQVDAYAAIVGANHRWRSSHT